MATSDKKLADDVKKPTKVKITNLLLFIANVAAFYILVESHLNPWFKQITIVGGIVTVWGLIKLISGLINKDEKDFLVSLLLKWPTAFYLGSTFLLALVLLFTTSSVYFTLDGSADNESDFIVEIESLTNGGQLIEPVRLSTLQEQKGKPFFWHTSDDSVVIRLRSSNFYKPDTNVISSSNSLRLRVPGNFKPKPLYLVRVIPSGKILDNLPMNRRNNNNPPYTLEVNVRGHNYRVDTLIQQEVFFGATSRELNWGVKMLDQKKMERFATWHYESGHQNNQRALHEALTINMNRQLLPTQQLTPDDSIEVRLLLDQGNNNFTILYQEIFKVDSADITTIILEDHTEPETPDADSADVTTTIIEDETI